MATAIRTVHRFTILLAAVSEITDAMEDAVWRAGCDDALLCRRAGQVSLRFDRAAETLGEALGTAVNDVGRAGFAVVRVHVVEGDATAD